MQFWPLLGGPELDLTIRHPFPSGSQPPLPQILLQRCPSRLALGRWSPAVALPSAVRSGWYHYRLLDVHFKFTAQLENELGAPQVQSSLAPTAPRRSHSTLKPFPGAAPLPRFPRQHTVFWPVPARQGQLLLPGSQASLSNRMCYWSPSCLSGFV